LNAVLDPHPPNLATKNPGLRSGLSVVRWWKTIEKQPVHARVRGVHFEFYIDKRARDRFERRRSA